MFDLAALGAAVARHGRVARIVLAERRGSSPREAGAAMLVWPDGQAGTIGGGRLEFEAVAQACAMLRDGTAVHVGRHALGPALNQCCGGTVTLVTEVYDAALCSGIAAGAGVHVRPVASGAGPLPGTLERAIARQAPADRPMPVTLQGGWLAEPLWRGARTVCIHGAGHVGRALATILAPLPQFDVRLTDSRAEALRDLPEGIATRLATTPAEALSGVPEDAAHFIMTPAHDVDLALCHALLSGRFGQVGLIGSATKWARFRKRLAALGHPEDQIARIACPIGDPALGRAPQAIAIGVAADLLRQGASGPRG